MNKNTQKDLTTEEIEQQKKLDEANAQRIAEMQQVKIERERKFRDNEDIKLNREQMMENVSSIIIKHILAAELYINKPTEGASLFNESNFKR